MEQEYNMSDSDKTATHWIVTIVLFILLMCQVSWKRDYREAYKTTQVKLVEQVASIKKEMNFRIEQVKQEARLDVTKYELELSKVQAQLTAANMRQQAVTEENQLIKSKLKELAETL